MQLNEADRALLERIVSLSNQPIPEWKGGEAPPPESLARHAGAARGAELGFPTRGRVEWVKDHDEAGVCWRAMRAETAGDDEHAQAMLLQQFSRLAVSKLIEFSLNDDEWFPSLKQLASHHGFTMRSPWRLPPFTSMVVRATAAGRELLEPHADGGDGHRAGKRKRKRGRPKTHDPLKDEKLVGDWENSGLTKAEYEQDRDGVERGDVQRAIDRRRKDR